MSVQIQETLFRFIGLTTWLEKYLCYVRRVIARNTDVILLTTMEGLVIYKVNLIYARLCLVFSCDILSATCQRTVEGVLTL